MQIMRTQHKFNATTKMYKSRLATWNVRKYMNCAERETACRMIKLKQGASETPGKVIVRGKARSHDSFLRHMGQSRAGVRKETLLVDSWKLEDIVIDTSRTTLPDSQIWPLLYPKSP